MSTDTPFTQVAEEVEQLLDAGKHSEALLVLKEVGTSSLSRLDYGYYCILSSETMLHLEVYDGIPIDEALRVFERSSMCDKLARANYVKGWLLSSNGHHCQALDHHTKAYTDYLQLGSARDVARVLSRMAYSSMHIGRYQAAIDNLEMSIRIYRELHETTNAWLVSGNLAQLYMRGGDLKSAWRTYCEQISNIDLLSEKGTLICYQMACLPLALRGDLKAAKATIAKCAPYLDTYPREKAIYLENLGLIHILAGEYPQARKALLEGLELSLKIAPESALVSQTKRLLADLHVALRKYDLARQYAEQALAVAEKIGQKVEIAACWRVFAQLAAHESRSDEARNWYRKAIDLFALISSR